MSALENFKQWFVSLSDSDKKTILQYLIDTGGVKKQLVEEGYFSGPAPQMLKKGGLYAGPAPASSTKCLVCGR